MRDKVKTPLNKKWCPHGRLSMQNWEDGVFKQAIAGTYNMSVTFDRLRGMNGSIIQPVTPCQGKFCAHYKRDMFRREYCGLEPSDNLGAWVFAALIALEIVAISATWLIKHFL